MPRSLGFIEVAFRKVLYGCGDKLLGEELNSEYSKIRNQIVTNLPWY
jgi:hypothetical protein